MEGSKKSPVACVTGASGFLGFYVVRALLEKGYTVHATVRNAKDEKKNQHLLELMEGASVPGRLQLFSADLNTEGSFDAPMEGCDYVCHVATNVALKSKNPQKEIVDPAVNGTLNVLRSVIKARTAKRVVITSSRAAVVIGRPKSPDYVYTENDWNTVLDVKSAAYPMAKTLAEKAAWEIYNNQTGDWRFELITMLPGMTLGPVLCKQHVHTSPQVIKDLMDGTMVMAPDIELDVVDVRDVADAHVLALELESAHGRYILISKNTTFIEAARILKPVYPKYRVPTRVAPNWLCYLVALFHPTVTWSFLRNQLGVKTELSNSKAQTELGLTFRPVEESILDTAQSLVHLKLV